ncbi:MAG: helix-turn-helix transcriptional regulator [Salinivirgaceae bacterium]|jgi:transcriptional regulator with XRE-family HTH domain
MSEEKILTFGEYIRELRESTGLPLRKVAAQLDIDPSLLGKIERNSRPPNIEIIKKLADIFGQNENNLITEYLSDQIAYKIIEVHGDVNVLKVAEKKIDYIIKQKNEQKT